MKQAPPSATLMQVLGGLPPGTFGLAALVLALSWVIALTLLAQPLYLLHVMDSDAKTLPTLLTLTGMFIGAILLAVWVRTLREKLIYAILRVLERKLYIATLRASIRMARQGRPEMASITLSDFARVRGFLMAGHVQTMADLTALPVPIFFMFGMHPLLGWLTVAGCVLIAVFSFLAQNSSKSALAEASKLSATADGDLARDLGRRDEVVGLGLLPGILRLWLPTKRRALTLEEGAHTRAEALSSIGTCIGMLTMSSAALLSAYLIINHEATLATLAASHFIIMRCTSPFERIASHWSAWGGAIAGVARLQLSLAFVVNPPAVQLDQPDGGVHLHALRLEVPGTGRHLVDDLNLFAPPGHVVAITGANGTGKSTLLRALVGLVTPVQGAVYYRGWVQSEVERSVVGPHVGYLAQRPQLLDGTVLENICRFAEDSEAGFVAARLAGAHSMIGRLPDGYAAPAGPTAGLSGGQQRQIALARALYGNPGLLVLDEPEVSLDGPALKALLLAVAEMRRRGAVVFMVTHELERWEGIADLELRLEEGGAWSTRVLSHRHELVPTT